MKAINFTNLSSNAQRKIINTDEAASTPVAIKSGRGHRIDFVPNNLWDLFCIQNKSRIKKGDIKVVSFS